MEIIRMTVTREDFRDGEGVVNEFGWDAFRNGPCRVCGNMEFWQYSWPGTPRLPYLCAQCSPPPVGAPRDILWVDAIMGGRA
jgi:hypothetical protein